MSEPQGYESHDEKEERSYEADDENDAGSSESAGNIQISADLAEIQKNSTPDPGQGEIDLLAELGAPAPHTNQ